MDGHRVVAIQAGRRSAHSPDFCDRFARLASFQGGDAGPGLGQGVKEELFASTDGESFLLGVFCRRIGGGMAGDAASFQGRRCAKFHATLPVDALGKEQQS